MHGLIFVTWEKYLAERFGQELLHTYRSSIQETATTAPLVSRVYDDATLLAGVAAASHLTRLPPERLLREYGRYFIVNGLTSHLCAFLLSQVQSGSDLLLTMREAHAQMRRTPDALTPPLFDYEVTSFESSAFALLYRSQRHLCPVLWGAIEGAAERYGERVQIVETACMKQGAAVCRFELSFFRPSSGPLDSQETAEQVAQRQAQYRFATLVLHVLPTHAGITLAELQALLRRRQLPEKQTGPRVLLEALRLLQHAGLVASTANQPDDNLTNRRYWRAPTSDGVQETRTDGLHSVADYKLMETGNQFISMQRFPQ